MYAVIIWHTLPVDTYVMVAATIHPLSTADCGHAQWKSVIQNTLSCFCTPHQLCVYTWQNSPVFELVLSPASVNCINSMCVFVHLTHLTCIQASTVSCLCKLHQQYVCVCTPDTSHMCSSQYCLTPVHTIPPAVRLYLMQLICIWESSLLLVYTASPVCMYIKIYLNWRQQSPASVRYITCVCVYENSPEFEPALSPACVCYPSLAASGERTPDPAHRQTRPPH